MYLIYNLQLIDVHDEKINNSKTATL